MAKKLLHTFILLLLTSVLSLAQQVEKTLVKSFNLQGNQTVVLDLNGPVEVKTWNQTTMRVQMNVALLNSSSSTLKSLVQYGRYNLRSAQEEASLRIFAPGLDRAVKIGGQEIDEIISFIIFTPEDIEVKMPGANSNEVFPLISPSSL